LKRCSKCRVEKEEEGFAKDSSRSDGFRPYCRPCDNAQRRAWLAAHPGHDRARHAAHPEYERRKKYGIGPRDFWDLFEAQEGICPYCLKALDPNHANNVDHEGGKRTFGDWTKVRGILHWQCNSQLQNHTEESLQRALNYLRNPPAWALWGSNEVQSRSNEVQSPLVQSHSNEVQSAA
jgi:hypothetical protein